MGITVKDLKKNDRVQNQFALYYLLDNGKNNLLNDEFFSKFKKDIQDRDDKGSIISNGYAIGALEIARDMASLSHKEIYDFIYDEVKEQKRQERGR